MTSFYYSYATMLCTIEATSIIVFELKREIFTHYRGKSVLRAPRHVIKRTLTKAYDEFL